MSLKVCPQCGNEYELDVRFCPLDGSTLRAQGAGNDLVGTVVAERYEVLKKLGEGGMGQVYLAQHIRIKRKSALKIMHPSMVHDPDAISRFYREAENASKISHQNVAAIYDFGETSDGLIYLAMEFVEGQPLTNLIETAGPLPARRAAEITRQAAEALGVAHDMGIVHRDLKPDNIMIARNRDGSDCVKVVDFGIAKVADNEAQKVTKTGLVVGTPEYMSPEQLAGDKLDGRSDIYSLALVAFNMFTGKLPFPSETVQESMIMRLTDRPRRLGEMKPDVAWPPELEAVMERALARDSHHRYQRATDFGRALVQAVSAMPDRMTAAEGGTLVMSTPAVPATLVGRQSPASGAGATAVVDASSRGATVDVPAASGASVAATGEARRRSVAPLVGGGVLALALLVGGWVAMSKRGDASVTPGTAPAASERDSAAVASATDTGAVPSLRDAVPPAGGTAGVTPRGTQPSDAVRPAAGAARRRYDASAELAQLDKLTELSDANKATASATMKQIDALLARPISGADSVEALLYRAQGYMLLEDQDGACSTLALIRNDQRNRTRSDLARKTYTALGCP
ncbi:MAG: protein kinase domain-containing protein [Gemmatimonadaceae bacterium]